MIDLRNDLQRHEDGKFGQAERRRFEEKLSSLERKLAESQQETHRRLTSIQTDLETSLMVSEQKCKKLDKVYQAAQVENELLYDRFNTELAKVFHNVKVEGMDAASTKLREAQNEVARLKRENFRLKRENINFRSQLTG
jgi:hypothetical protein